METTKEPVVVLAPIHVKQSLIIRLRELARQEDRSIAWIVRKAIEEICDRKLK